jgi:hypothetical protein
MVIPINLRAKVGDDLLTSASLYYQVALPNGEMSYANRTSSANFNISFGDGGFSKPIQLRNRTHRRS